jgi:hypothetical protein
MKTPKVFTEIEKNIVRQKVINRAKLERRLLQEKLEMKSLKTGPDTNIDFILEILEEN